MFHHCWLIFHFRKISRFFRSPRGSVHRSLDALQLPSGLGSVGPMGKSVGNRRKPIDFPIDFLWAFPVMFPTNPLTVLNLNLVFSLFVIEVGMNLSDLKLVDLRNHSTESGSELRKIEDIIKLVR
jgi:hypothetical protein